MKKVIFFLLFFLVAISGKSQFLNSIGITAGVSAGNQKFYFKDPDALSKKKYILGFNGSVFAEFFSHDYVRWVTEIQYNQKGSVDEQPEQKYRNKLQYLSWNNYLKLRYQLYSITPYILIGPRLEYMLSQSTTSPTITNNFSQIHVSAALGGGVEFVSFTNFKFFIEGFYNPDVMWAYKESNLNILNKNFELRIGLKYEFSEKRESCNSPTYIDE